MHLPAELDAAVPDTDKGQTGAFNTLCGLMNSTMEIINEWLAAGGARSGGRSL